MTTPPPEPTPDALITTAKAIAGPVVRWVTRGEPLGALIGTCSWGELAALVAVLADVVAHCEDGERVLAEVAAADDGPAASPVSLADLGPDECPFAAPRECHAEMSDAA